MGQIEKAEIKLGEVFDLIRNEGIHFGDYDVILFLLSLRKDHILPDINFKDTNEFLSAIGNAQREVSNRYEKIIPIYSQVLEGLTNNSLGQIVKHLYQIDNVVFAKYYTELFENILAKITMLQGRFSGEYFQPIELTRIFWGLYPNKNNIRVYNPFAGLASFAFNYGNKSEYFGQEINTKTWAIGTLRLMAHEYADNRIYVCEDSIENWPSKNDQYDLVISNPPFGARFSREQQMAEPGYRTFEHLFIEKGIKILSENGMLISLIPQKLLFQEAIHERRLRELIVNEDLLDTVIALPTNILTNTGMPLALVVLKKKKIASGFIKFVDATSCFFENSPRSYQLDDKRILEYLADGTKSELVKVVSIKEICDNSYNLSVSRYFKKSVEGTKLGTILVQVRGENINPPYQGKIIRIRDLNEGIIDHQLDVSSIHESEITRRDFRNVSESCILLAGRWKTLKPTVFNFNGEPIAVSSDILTYKISEDYADQVDISYLVNELNANYVQEQIEAFRLGTVVPFIRREDLMNVVVKLIPIDEQKAKSQGLKELTDKIKKLEAERDSIALGLTNKLYESVSTIKHSLGKPLLNIGSSIRNIEASMHKLNPDWESFKINPRYAITLKESFISVFNNLDLIHSVLKNNETVFDVSNYQLSELDFEKFIEIYVRDIKAASKPNVDIELDIHPDITNNIKEVGPIQIISNEELLKIALNTIVENAYMHGFIDKEKKYKLEFRISLFIPSVDKKLKMGSSTYSQTFIKVEIANNGKPFPEKFTLEKFIRRNSYAGETGNTGQGGFDLNEIIRYHNNGQSTLELILDDFSKGFTTTYSFLLPINR